MKVVTSGSQFTTENPKLKISPKIPPTSGRTLATAPGRANHEAILSYPKTQNCSAAKILKNKTQNFEIIILINLESHRCSFPQPSLSPRHNFKNKEASR